MKHFYFLAEAKKNGVNFGLIIILLGIFNLIPNVTVKAKGVFHLAPPSITYQPNSLEVAENNSTIFYVGSNDADTYQWQVRSGGSWSNLSNAAPYSGVDTKLLALSSVNGLNDKQYRCIVSNAGGSTTSDPARLVVVSSDLRINVGDAGNSCFIAADRDMWHTGDDGQSTLRNIFTGTSANGNNPYQVKWSTGLSRWELRLDADHDGVYEVLTHYNSNTSAPNPPNLSAGTWVDNGQGCGSLGTFEVLIPTPGSLTAGDIAFVGFNSDSPDGFSFVALKNIPANEVIYFTDHGWAKGSSNTWMLGSEAHFSWTAPAGGLPAGSIVSIIETSANVLTVTGGGTVGNIVEVDGKTAESFSLLSDNLFAYQGILGSLNPTFLTGLLADDNYLHTSGCDNLTTKWFTEDIDATNCLQMTVSPPSSGGTSTIAPGLTNGTNAVMLNPFLTSSPSVTVAEVDNYKYNGTFSGTREELATAINDYNNWLRDDNNTYAINPSDYNGGSGFSITNGSVTFNSEQIDPGTGCDSPIAAIAENPVDGKQYAFTMVGTNANAVYKLLRYDGGSTWVTLGSFSPSDVPAPFDLGMLEVDLAISPDGTFHIAFTGQEDADCCNQVRGIWYASSSNGSSWSFTQLLTHPGSYNYTPILRIGSDGYPRMASIFNNTSTLGYEARYSTYNGTTWNTETVFTESNGTNFLNALSFDLDANDKAHLAIQKKTNGSGYDNGLWYTTNAGGSWPANLTEIAPAVACCGGAPPFYEIQGINPTIAIDGNNKVHIVHTDYNGNIQYVTNTSGTFTSTPLNGGLIGNSHKDGLQILPNGNKFLSFKTSGALKYAYLLSGQSGNWTTGDAFVEASDFANYYYSNLSTGGKILYTFDRLASGSCGTGNPRTLNFVTATLPEVPEINIKGNGQNIVDGANSPSTTDSTDFGTLAINGESNTNTFTIENNGTGSLTLSGSPRVAITGHTSDFIVTVQPSSATVAASGSTTFQITFDPTASGLREATVTIANDDADENPYTFAIQGTGIAQTSSPAIISLLPNSNFDLITSSINGTDGAENSRAAPTFTDIDGDGLIDLIIGYFDGSLSHYEQNSSNSTLFSLVTQDFNLIDVGFYAKPTFTDLDNDGLLDLIIGESDGNLNHYEQNSIGSQSFTLVTNNFNSILVVDNAAPTFTDIDNDGLLDLLVGEWETSPSFESRIQHYEQNSTNSLDFSLVDIDFNDIEFTFGPVPVFTDIDGDGLLNLIVAEAYAYQNGIGYPHYEQISTNSQSFSLITTGMNQITKANESAIAFSDFDGDGLLDLLHGTQGGEVQHYEQSRGTFTAFSSNVGGNSANQTIEIRGKSLEGAITLTAPANFEVSTSASSGFAGSLTLSQTGGIVPLTTVYVRFSPVSSGTFNGNLSLTSSNATTILHALSGSTPTPEINLKGNGVSIANGDNSPSLTDSTDFGSHDVASGSNTNTFTIENTGAGSLTLNGNPKVSITGAHTSDFSVTTLPNSPIAASGSTTFQITFDPTATGLRQATVSITNDDADESPYTFVIQGTGNETVINPCTTSFFENFELNIIPPDWTNLDLDNNTSSNGRPANWYIYEFDEFDINGNNKAAVSDSWFSPVSQANNWLILPKIILTCDTKLSWKSAPFEGPAFADGYEVKISTIDNNPASFSTVLMDFAEDITEGSGVWGSGVQHPNFSGRNGILTEWEIDLSAYTGQTVYIAFHHNSTNDNLILLDDIGIGPLILNPEINLKGNDNDILSGSTIPSLEDSTDFGALDLIGESNNNTFTIENTGAGSLTLNGNPKIAITGAHTSDFIVTTQPNSPIAASGSTTFQITFDPTTTGLRQATVSITNDDADENPYTFAISGTGCDNSASISYSGSPYCSSASPAAVSLTGTSGGAFTSSPAGLTLNSSTGQITPSSSTAGVYTVTYTIAASGGCSSAVATTSVTITDNPSASISYSGSPYCSSASPAAVSLTGTSGGAFTSSPAGLTLNSSTGQITPSSSTAGVYTVTYTIAASGGCSSAVATTSVTITDNPSASISYSGSPYCSSASPAAVSLTGTSGGAFTSSPAGLTLNSSTGQITPSSSTAGVYTVTYTVAASGGCSSAVATTSVTITDNPSAAISYAGSPYCSSASSAAVSLTGTSGGAFTSSPAGLTLNSSSGQITPSSSTAGVYTVTYTVAASGGCSSAVATTSVTISDNPSASISYAGSPYCSSASPAAVSLTGTSGGAFTSSPAGLTLNSSTGQITPSSSTAGVYTVTYTVAASGGCSSAVATTSVTITDNPSASISYSGSPYCSSASPAAVSLTGTSGGAFTSSPAGLTLNSSTGQITPSSSTAGVYTVTYTIAASGECSSAVATTSVTITDNPSASISYSGSPYCSSASPAAVSLTGTSGGAFTSSPAGLTLNSSTGQITPSSSTAGVYTVTYTVAASGGCSSAVATTSVTITDNPSASISYSGSPYCSSASPAAVSLTGTSGGAFTSSPAGLTLNSSTGQITPSSSTAGVYTVTYTVAASGGCSSAVATTSVTITNNPSASISYSGSPYCSSASPAAVSLTGTSGGAFTSSPAGLTLNSSTGQITPSSSTAGVYTVTYTIAASGGCSSAVATTSVTISDNPSASISYSGSPYCSSASPAAVSLTGTSGGAFTSSPAGLTLNSSTGQITPSSSTAGVYTVTYTIAASGGCSSAVATTSVTITDNPSASISYSGSPYCSSASPAAVSLTGTSGGAFTSSPAGLTLNSSTGQITPSSSTAGVYTVTYTIAASGGCSSAVATTSVTITDNPSASISYSGSPYCSSASPAAVSLTGTSGGAFTSSPAGLTLNSSTGQITPSSSTAGVYTVTYTIAASGGCSSAVATTSVTISDNPSASISYSGSPYCSSASPAAVSLTGTSGGAFTSSPAGLTLNSSTGQITPSSSTAGVYTVTYTIAASGGCSSAVATTSVTITDNPSASISYSGSPYCSSASPAAVRLTGTSGGAFTSSPAGLTLNSSTGQITPSSSTAGVYTVTYTVAASGGCSSAVATTSVTITNNPSASISYSGSPYCSSASPAAVSLTGTSGGAFTSSPAGLTLNSSTGQITPSSSTAGVYTVTYTVAASGGCSSAVATTSVTITDNPSASISYSGSPYCSSASSAAVSLTGTSGGAFTSSPAGLTLNSSSGQITPSSSTAGVYTVTYTVAASGGCSSAVATTSVTINQPDNAGFSYSANTFCTSQSDPSAIISGVTGGTFSSSPAGLVLNSGTGLIDLSESTTGTYSITYATAGVCGNSSSVSLSIVAPPTISILGSDNLSCTAASVTRTASGASSYSWSNGLGNNAQVSITTPGIYTVTGTSTDGCSATATTEVLDNTTEIIASASNSGPYFEGSLIQLMASGGGVLFLAGARWFYKYSSKPFHC